MTALSSPLDVQNRVLRAADRRIDRLEERLAELLVPILERAGARAAAEFQRKATDHLTAAAPGLTRTSTMIAVKPTPEQASRLGVPGGEDPETLHVTLAFLGDVEGDLEAVAEALRPVAAVHAPLSGTVGGAGSFASAPDTPTPRILLPDVPGLVELRVAVTEALARAGIDYSRLHGFCPHMTVAYGDASDGEEERALGEPLSFGELLVVRSNAETIALPLVGPPPLTASPDSFLDDLAAYMARPLEDPGRPTDRLSFGPITAASDPPQWSSPAGDELLDVDALVKTLRTKTDPVRLALLEASMTPTLKAAGLAFDVTNPLTAKVLAQSGSQVTHIAETTRANVMRTIRTAYREGLSIPDTAKAIQAGMRDAAPTRARLIARTELAGAVNGGSLASVRIVSGATGDTYFKQWLTAPGAVNPRHEEYDGLDGQTIPLDDSFDVGGTPLEYPGDPGGPPDEVCNCRCTIVYTEKPPEGETPDRSGGGTSGEGEGGDVDGGGALAARMFAQAVELEPETTAELSTVAGQAGGRMAGLDFAVKTEASLERKIASDMADAAKAGEHLSVAEVAGTINDALRYTMTFPEAGYARGVRDAISRLERAGYEPVKVKNYWGNADYQGINAVFAKDGRRFELQFHTPRTFELKSALHPQYEAFRTSADPLERLRLWNEMAAEQKRNAVPPDALSIGQHVTHAAPPSVFPPPPSGG